MLDEKIRELTVKVNKPPEIPPTKQSYITTVQNPQVESVPPLLNSSNLLSGFVLDPPKLSKGKN